MAGLQVTLIVNVTVVFAAALLGVVACISRLRRLRQRRRETLAELFAPFSDETRPMPPIDDTQLYLPLLVPVKSPNRQTFVPNAFRFPTQAGAPEAVLLFIEPLEGPTRDQRNVQKLIDFLKQETVEAKSV
jgi:hypothetical protein